MTINQSEIGCPECDLRFSIPDSLHGNIIACPSCKKEFQSPPPIATQQTPTDTTFNTFDAFVDATRSNVEYVGKRATKPATAEFTEDTWGAIGTIAGGISAGLLLVGMCFTPMACCAVPLSIGGIISALFSNNKRLRTIGLIGNSIILFLSLAIVIWISFGMAMALQKFDRY